MPVDGRHLCARLARMQRHLSRHSPTLLAAANTSAPMTWGTHSSPVRLSQPKWTSLASRADRITTGWLDKSYRAGAASLVSRQDGYVTSSSTQRATPFLDWPAERERGRNSSCLSGWKESAECQVRRRSGSLMRAPDGCGLDSVGLLARSALQLHFCFTGLQS